MGLGLTPAVQSTPLFPTYSLHPHTYFALACGSKNNILPYLVLWWHFLPSVWARNWHLHLNLLCNPLPWHCDSHRTTTSCLKSWKFRSNTAVKIMRNCSMLCLSFLAIILVHLADCDIYLHSLRGSNNRLNENSANRKHANRVFDSQVSKKDTLPLKLCCVQQNLTSGKSVVVLSNQYNLLCNATVLEPFKWDVRVTDLIIIATTVAHELKF